MGLYAEPPGDKLAWIKQHGTPVFDLRALEANCFRPTDAELPVAVMEQGFVALGVAFNRAELRRFLQGRIDAQWYLVRKADLRQVVPGGEKIRELR